VRAVSARAPSLATQLKASVFHTSGGPTASDDGVQTLQGAFVKGVARHDYGAREVHHLRCYFHALSSDVTPTTSGCESYWRVNVHHEGKIIQCCDGVRCGRRATAHQGARHPDAIPNAPAHGLWCVLEHQSPRARCQISRQKGPRASERPAV